MRWLSAILVFLFSCSRHETPRVEPVPAPSAVPSASAVPPSTESIYLLKMKLVDQDGKTSPLDVFRGHPVIVAMFYGTCTSACPTLTSDINAIEKRLAPETRADLRVLMVSFDPERDTPAALHKLTDKHEVDTARWKFATSSEGSVRELSAVLGVQYRKIDHGDFSHSAKITLLDRDGNIASQIDGLGQPSDDLTAVLRSFARDE